MQRLALFALLAVLSPWVNAQRWGNAPGTGVPVSHHYPIPASAIFFADPFYSDALYRQGSLAAAQPPVIILQAAPVQAPATVPSAPPAQPLMIELQGDRYVRISGEESSTAELIDPAPIHRVSSKPEPERAVANAARSAMPAEHPSAALSTVLVFRDGRQQEVTEYTIADGVLYAHTDYFTAGTWNQKIALSSLNVPATIEANQSRGLKFRLPGAPNEVVVGQ